MENDKAIEAYAAQIDTISAMAFLGLKDEE